MKLAIHSAHAGNGQNLRTWLPDNENIFSEFVHVAIGERGRKGADGFSIRIATPAGLLQLSPKNGVLACRPLLVVDRYSFENIWTWLSRTVMSCEDDTWIQCVEKLRCHFDWEFDDWKD